MPSDLASPLNDQRSDDRGAVVAPTRLLLMVAVTAQGVVVVLTVLLAVLIDRQGDILAARSEARGGFDPTVFPPYSDGIWLVANGTAVLSVVLLVALIALNLALRGPRRR